MTDIVAAGYLIGAGSMTLGIEKAGAQVTAIYETPGYAKNAATWELNRPELPVRVLPLDHNCPVLEDLRGVDLVYGNPPCGGLSSMTGAKISSPTNNCMRQWVRMVMFARPRHVLMENGWTLVVPRAKPLLSDLTSVLSHAGYKWWTWRFYSWQVGTPQVRQRAFVCATLADVKRPELKELSDLPKQWSEVPQTWAGAYLSDLAETEPSPGPVVSSRGETVLDHWYDREETYRTGQECGRLRDRIEPGTYATLKDVEWLKKSPHLDEARRAALIEKAQAKLWPDAPSCVNGMAMFRPDIVHFDRPGRTVIGGYTPYLHPTADRFLTMRELARLMGYPDSWRFHKLYPNLIAQGVPVNNTAWALDRVLRAVGERS